MRTWIWVILCVCVCVCDGWLRQHQVGPFSSLAGCCRRRRRWRAWQPSVRHGSSPWVGNWAGRAAERRRGCPSVYTHDAVLPSPAWCVPTALQHHTHALCKCKIYCKIPTPQKSFGIPSVPRQDGKAKAGVPHSDCGWKCGCAGKTVRSLENTCHTWALLRWCFTKMRYIKCTYLYLLYLWHGPLSDRKGICPEMNEWVSEWVTSLLLALHHR